MRLPRPYIVLLGATCLALAQCRASISPPSIIFISVDTLRADHLGCYGYFRPTSPVIDEFARGAILFERALVPMSTTLPSHVSLMTSMNPMRHGVQGNFAHLDTSLVTSNRLFTAAQLLERQGYTTAAFISSVSLKSHSGIGAGFAVYDEPAGKVRNAEATTNRVLEWLSAAEARPLFLWVHYFDPHWPYRAPPPFVDIFETEPGLLEFLRAKGVPKPDGVVLRVNNLYDGAIRYLDLQLARLFADLRAAELYDASVIVFTADHGEGLGQHDWIDHGRIYDEQLHVPLIIKLPAPINTPGERSLALASLIDVLPTVVSTTELALGADERAQLRAQFEGIDLLDGAAREYVFSERVNRQRGWGPGQKYSLTSLDWKYFLSTEGPDELFDLSRDRNETRNVIEEHPEVAAIMKEALLARIQQYRETPRPEKQATPLPPSVVQELESLGYVQ